jgi:hypothetical protein
VTASASIRAHGAGIPLVTAPGAPAGAPGASQGPAGTRAGQADWLAWFASVNFAPTSFITLTFDDRYSEVGADWVRGLWKKLVHELNKDVGGRDYRRKFKHSYFSYVMTLEYQTRGALHVHALVDNWIDYDLLHRLWNSWAGFAWVKRVHPSSEHELRYVLKYVTKDSAPLVWFKRDRVQLRRVDLRGV